MSGPSFFPTYRKFNNLQYAQRGLFDSYHKYGKFVTCFLTGKQNTEKDIMQQTIQTATEENKTKEAVLNLYRELYNKSLPLPGRSRILLAFKPQLWMEWGSFSNLEKRPEGEDLIDTSRKFANTEGDIFFYIKSDDADNAAIILKELEEALKKISILKYTVTESVVHGNTNILGGQFREGIGNISDPQTADKYITIGEIGNGEPGATYMFSQKFKINWNILETKTKAQKEEMIGRKMYTNSLIPISDTRRHIKCAHLVDDITPPFNVTKKLRRVFRQSIPYGKSETGNGREEGVFFICTAQSLTTIEDILKQIAGHNSSVRHDTTMDALISLMMPIEGTFWYVPSALELQLSIHGVCKVDLDPHWSLQSKNLLLFYNHKDYLHRMTMDQYIMDDAPSSRVLYLLQYTFEQWNDIWFQKVHIPELPDLHDVLKDHEKDILDDSIPMRKGMAIKKCLGEVMTTSDLAKEPNEFYGWKADVFSIHPSEIIVGRMPRGFSLGLGKVVMKYLDEDEKMSTYLMGLSEASAVGHVVPDHAKVLRLGVNGLLQEIETRSQADGLSNEQVDFYRSCRLAVEGVQQYIANYGKLAEHLSTLDTEYTKQECNNLKEISKRMAHLSCDPPRDFTEAVQLVFTFHCCLHLIGQPVAIGRIDQLLAPYLWTMPVLQAQEVIDCFWIKFGERVNLTPHFVTDLGRWGQTAVPYTTDGSFPRGDSINQWVQQITVGGYEANDDPEPKPASNEITMMCLRAARRLPLIAPCLSLRVHKNMPNVYLEEAARAILSGGAHPILLHDDRLTAGMHRADHLLPNNIPLHDVRNLACDGCYEPMIAGKSEFAFAYVALPQIVELATNEGNKYLVAGPAFLSGAPASYHTPKAKDIKTFAQLQKIFKEHLHIQIEKNLYGLLVNYGNIWKACPAPLLSSVIDGCLESGRDLYNGGATYHLIACMFIGFANCIDSLYAIKKMCFDDKTASVNLDLLLRCLKCDWGFDIQEPFIDEAAGEIRLNERIDLYKTLRDVALTFPKFGTDEGLQCQEIQDLVQWLSQLITSTFKKVVTNKNPKNAFVKLLTSLKSRYSTPDSPFDILFLPGSGTFEGYVGWGLGLGASADGRRKTMPIASDFSAAPTIQDGIPKPSYNNIFNALKNWDYEAINKGFSNGAEVDLNIREDFPQSEMVKFLRKYAEGDKVGGNVITVTCADPETYKKATEDPEKFDLLRVRMGGWTEHYVTMFDAHEKQHMRRPYYTPDDATFLKK